MIQIASMTMKHFSEANELFATNYKIERSRVKSLPPYKQIEVLAKTRLKTILKKHQGLVALENNKVVGYMMYIQGGKLFGNSECAFVPLIGHSATTNNKTVIYQSLFNKAAAIWVENRKLSLIVTLFEHDQNLEQFWFKNGFGQRCADAMTNFDSNYKTNEKIIIKKATKATLIDVKKLHKTHTQYYQTAPLFMPGDNSDSFAELSEWFNKSNRHLWIAYLDEEPVGYMRIEDTGESFITQTSDTVSITSAFINPEFRKKGIGITLLDTVKTYLKEETNYKRCGVDYESINPLARYFWETHFTPYTKTVTRRIDEGIIK